MGMPVVPAECEQSYHMFYLILNSLEERQALISHLKSHGILSVFHYVPLHLSEMGRKFGAQAGRLPADRGHQRATVALALLQRSEREAIRRA